MSPGFDVLFPDQPPVFPIFHGVKIAIHYSRPARGDEWFEFVHQTREAFE